LRRARKPISLDFLDDFVYDTGDGRFYDEKGPTSPKAMLDFVYDYHCRTLRRRFRFKWAILQGLRHGVRTVVWRLQDLCLWLLEHGYDIKPTADDEHKLPSPFRRYKIADFQRFTAPSGTQFFGFQSSPRSLFSNILVLGAACLVAYFAFKQSNLLRAIYGSTSLTTVALIFVFLVADQTVPFLLKAAVSGLSCMKPHTIFFKTKVKA
jgi:hypothetical protein